MKMTFEVFCLKILRLGARSFRSQEDKYTIHVTHKNNCRTNQTLKSTYSLWRKNASCFMMTEDVFWKETELNIQNSQALHHASAMSTSLIFACLILALLRDRFYFQQNYWTFRPDLFIYFKLLFLVVLMDFRYMANIKSWPKSCRIAWNWVWVCDFKRLISSLEIGSFSLLSSVLQVIENQKLDLTK